MNNARAIIIQRNTDALRTVAASARISTRQGDAMAVYGQSAGDEKDLRLVDKVLASGHKTVLEHQTLSVAFQNVSALVEQFLIEFRLISVTVKSRRYVDYAQAGFVVPDTLPDRLLPAYNLRMTQLFSLYSELEQAGVPREDARFVLPYCFRSNFFVTLNAREFAAMVSAMAYGRGSRFAEIKALGLSLKEQFDEMYPGVIGRESAACARCAQPPLPTTFGQGRAVRIRPYLLEGTENAEKTLETAMNFSGRFPGGEDGYLCAQNLLSLVRDARPRELETLHYLFRVEGLSLACLTHFTRHRMQTLLVPPVGDALAGGDYVLPESIAGRLELRKKYEDAFALQAVVATNMVREGMSPEDASYLAMAGHTTDLMMGQNARELLHFFKLRTCSRAQWEIRDCAREMLTLLQDREPMIFRAFGPSCAVEGRCPEGRLSCGTPQRLEIDVREES